MFSNLIVGAPAYLGDSLFVLVVFIILVALVEVLCFRSCLKNDAESFR